ncbi:hypothetical protein BC829DRAFT_396525 [Chytridium lagenaria]|nr:hypothetical protein BC829DRAFT_396525 [Chytridium lagenaria]
MLGLRSSAVASRLAGGRLVVQRRSASSSTDAAQKLASASPPVSLGYATPLIYYGRVALEFGRQVAVHGKITIPNPAQIGEAQLGIANFISAFQNGAWKKVTLRQAGTPSCSRNHHLWLLPCGEMIGRGSVIGYEIPGISGHGDHH